MSKAPAYQMYAQDFDMDTASWPNIAVGIYQRLLNYEWVNRGLPKDPGELASIAREKRIIFERNWSKYISQKFHENGSGLLINNKMESVRQDQVQYIESQRKKGFKSAKKRWGYELTGVTDGLQPSNQPEGKSSSSTSSSSSLNINSKEGEDTPFKPLSKEEIEEGSDLMILEQIEKICRQLYKEKIFPEVNAFKNMMLKKKKNPRSILHTLSRALIKHEFEEGPWAYCQKIIEVESAKYNARDYGKTS